MKSIFWVVSLVAATVNVTVESRSRVQPDPTAEVVDPNPHQIFTEEPSQEFRLNHTSQVVVDALDQLDEDDILLTDKQWADLKTRKAIEDERYRWPEGTDGFPLVPYVFPDSLDQDAVKVGLDYWMEHTCIRFEETTDKDQPHLQFVIGQGCASYVGMIYGRNGQTVKLASGCLGLDTVVHEVGHAIGFYHEQSRSDRDDYVTVVYDNILEERNGIFYKTNTNNYNVPYDYTSVMQYGQNSFSKNNKPVLVTTDILAQSLLSYRDGLSHRDKLLANRMYNCIEKWLNTCGILSEPCLNDGYTGKDCTCVCPTGTSGSNCEKIIGDYYAQVLDDLREHITTEKTIEIKAPKRGETFSKWIEPPACKKAKMTFTYSSIKDNSCASQNFYIKTDFSDAVGQSMCPSDISNGVTFESSIVIIITMLNWKFYPSDNKQSLWEADVTFEDIPGCSTTYPASMFTGPLDKIWSDSECTHLKNIWQVSLSECKAHCINNASCTAISFNEDKYCVLRGCSPVPRPTLNYPGYQGYAIKTEIMLHGTNSI